MVAEDGKIKSIKLFEQLKGQYLIYFSVNLLQKIFYDEEFASEFLRRILPMFIEEQQKQIEDLQENITQAQQCLDNLNKMKRVRKQNSDKES